MVNCGLDFGTSNSVLGVAAGGAVRLVPLEGGRPTLPSAVFYPFDGALPLFGRQAIASYVDGVEGRLLRALKSVLGTSLMQDVTRVKTRELSFSDMLVDFMGHIKTRAEQSAGQPLERVVLGRPVRFVDEDAAADAAAQEQLRLVALRCGFREVAFQFEPIAAALDYEQQVRGEELAFVVDIGGGTADFSVVRVAPERRLAAERSGDILANLGVHVGGTDFDRALSLASVMPLLGFGTPHVNGKQTMPAHYYFDLATWQRIHKLYGRMVLPELRQLGHEAVQPECMARMVEVVEGRFGHALAGKVEEAKVRLTDMVVTEVVLDFLRSPLVVEISRSQLEAVIGDLAARIVAAAQATLAAAGVGIGQIDVVFLTGGTTQVPLIRSSVLALFGDAVRVVEGDTFGSVATGLALEAGRKFG